MCCNKYEPQCFPMGRNCYLILGGGWGGIGTQKGRVNWGLGGGFGLGRLGWGSGRVEWGESAGRDFSNTKS